MSAATKGVWFDAGRYRLSPNGASQKKHPQPAPPQGYMRISGACDRLCAGMWGGFEAPVPRAFKAKSISSARFEGRQSLAAKSLTAAALEGKLRIYVVADPKLAPSIDHPRAAPPPTKDPIAVPTSALRRLITWRSLLPDRAIHPTIKTACGDLNLYVLLSIGMLIVQEREFKRWYRSEKSRGKWPSQRSRSNRSRGRPTKQTDLLKKQVLALVRDQAWSARDGIAKLRQILIDGGHLELPSSDTLERFIRQLYTETGNPRLFRKPRVKKKFHFELTAKFDQ
jgi:hypothetical protein